MRDVSSEGRATVLVEEEVRGLEIGGRDDSKADGVVWRMWEATR